MTPGGANIMVKSFSLLVKKFGSFEVVLRFTRSFSKAGVRRLGRLVGYAYSSSPYPKGIANKVSKYWRGSLHGTILGPE